MEEYRNISKFTGTSKEVGIAIGRSVGDRFHILSDPEVEQHNGLTGTVYSNIACPEQDIIRFAYDGFPAASQSEWKEVKWSW